MTPYEQLEARFEELHDLGHAQAMVGWDEAVMMPQGGGTARGEAMAALAALSHRALTAPVVGELLDKASADSARLSDWQQANLRAMRRMYTRAAALPEDLVRANELATTRCQQIWRGARANNDWSAVEGPLTEVVALAREEAAALGEALALDPYDALLDDYEEGTRAADVGLLFDELKSFLPDLIHRVVALQGEPLPLPGPFSHSAQHALGKT